MKKLEQSNFEVEVLKSTRPVLVDFWATWCGPCRMIAPLVEEASARYADRLDAGKVNVDENAQLCTEYGIVSIPTLIIFKDGRPAGKVIGYLEADELDEFIRKNL